MNIEQGASNTDRALYFLQHSLFLVHLFDIPTLPPVGANVKEGGYQYRHPVDPFTGPAPGNGHVEHFQHGIYITAIKNDSRYFGKQVDPGIACAGNRIHPYH
jgi:hypothetical protein